ncbi:MAG: N-acetylglucosamine-6-phosphate deacetylase [Chloroflexi bacterium]|nr:N-acetylglucosamine-6-phosphate deacetylase [Chloroflexota bacterium]
MSTLFIRCGTLVLPTETQHDVCVLARDGVIEQVAANVEAPAGATVIDATGQVVVPGFVDIHVHGAMGADTMDAMPEALETMSVFFARHGVTGFCPTTMTAQREQIDAALDTIKAVMARGTSGAQVLGAHIEGPYLNVKQCGAQPPALIRPANREEYCSWFDRGVTRLITIAPEVAGNVDLIDEALLSHIAVAIGHSDAEYATAQKCFQRGITQATHTFNGMRGLHHREPGTAGAVLANDDVVAQVIADNLHVHPAVMNIIYKCKTAAKLALITDAMEAAGLGDGLYKLGVQDITVRDGQARISNGSLAGSTLTMDTAFGNIRAATGCSLNDAARMCSLTPATSINLGDRKGNIAPGYDADVTILDDDLHVVKTIAGGRLVYERE